MQYIIDSNLPYEDDVYSDNTITVSFPVKIDNYVKGKNEVTLWEQLNNAADLQNIWSDNSVSITVTFNDKEKGDIVPALEVFEDKLKSASFLRNDTATYKQMPYEEISEEEYNKIVSKINKIDLSNTNEEAVGDKYCNNDTCEI